MIIRMNEFILLVCVMTSLTYLPSDSFEMDVAKDAYSLPEARLVFSMPASPRAIH